MFKFENLDIWKESKSFVVEIYKLTDSLTLVQGRALQDQLRRAALSVSLNIAEGCNCGSDKEFRRFLYIASRSLDEVVGCLHIAKELRYLEEELFLTLYQKAESLGKRISALKKSLISVNL